MNIAEALAAATERLENSGIPESRREAASLIAFAIGRERVFLIAHPEYILTVAETAAIDDSVKRRSAREPFQYIVGRQEFYALDFEVSPSVLIPRPETELLVARAIDELSKIDEPQFCEIGVGSGCISISVLYNVPNATAVGLDISEAALAVARKNAARHNVLGRLDLRSSDIYGSLTPRQFHAILSNPPYIPSSDMPALQPEVSEFEPRVALTDGGSGIEIIERIIAGAPTFLLDGGILMLEIGAGQSEIVCEMFDPMVWRTVIVLPDLQQIPRTVIAVKK